MKSNIRRERGESGRRGNEDRGGGKERRFSWPDPLLGRSGPAHRKLVRAASDCEDNCVVLYAEFRRDIGWSHRTPPDDFPADSFLLMGFRYAEAPRQRELQVRIALPAVAMEEDPSTSKNLKLIKGDNYMQIAQLILNK